MTTVREGPQDAGNGHADEQGKGAEKWQKACRTSSGTRQQFLFLQRALIGLTCRVYAACPLNGCYFSPCCTAEKDRFFQWATGNRIAIFTGSAYGATGFFEQATVNQGKHAKAYGFATPFAQAGELIGVFGDFHKTS